MHRLYQKLKNVFHWARAHFWRAWFGFPDKGIRLYGVTGTNGKTTTCYLIDSILATEYGREKAGMLTTVGIHIGKKDVLNETKMTTLKSYEAMKYLRDMKNAGVTHAVLEVTSHALDQNRLAGLRLEGAIITNIAREHLDYHGTMEEYTAAKMRILEYIREGGSFVYKGDDEWIGAALRQIPNPNDQFPIKSQIPPLRHPELASPGSKEGSAVQAMTKTMMVSYMSEDAKEVVTLLPGEVNKENVLAASLLMREAGVSEDAIRRGVDAVTHVPGRMEWIAEKPQTPNPPTSLKLRGAGNDQSNPKPPHFAEATRGRQIPNDERRLPRVLIDYAVTPDALERLYRDVRQNTRGKVYAVLGACGMRDRGKRPDMARTVAQYADELVLTREDPWTESEEQIFGDLEKGLNEYDGCGESGDRRATTPAGLAQSELTPLRRAPEGAGFVGWISFLASANGWRKRPACRQIAVEEDGAKPFAGEVRRGENKNCWRRITDRREAIKYCLEKAGAEDVVVVTGKGAETGMAIGKKVIPWNDKAVVLELFEEIRLKRKEKSNGVA